MHSSLGLCIHARAPNTPLSSAAGAAEPFPLWSAGPPQGVNCAAAAAAPALSSSSPVRSDPRAALPRPAAAEFDTLEPPPHGGSSCSSRSPPVLPPPLAQLTQYQTFLIDRQDILEGPAPPPPPLFNVNLAALGRKRRSLLAAGDAEADDFSADDTDDIDPFASDTSSSSSSSSGADAASGGAGKPRKPHVAPGSPAARQQLAAAAAAEEARRQRLRDLITREREEVARTGRAPEPFERGSPEAIFEQHVLALIVEGHACGGGQELAEGSRARRQMQQQAEMAHARRRVRRRPGCQGPAPPAARLFLLLPRCGGSAAPPAPPG